MLWENLNKRQQTYLQSVYELDQAQEANIKRDGARGRWNNTPASVWRWMPYNASGAALLRMITDAGYVDQGTGSTFAALERRGLVQCKYEPGSLGGPILFVQITREGRKLVREALGLTAPKSLPVGTLREWHWRALCRAYVRGDEGIGEYDADLEDGYGYVSWNTVLRLRDYTVKGQEKPLVGEKRFSGETVETVGGYPFKRNYIARLCITEFGREYYRDNWHHYRTMYPDVDAPEPEI
jgi:hypothetical protein